MTRRSHRERDILRQSSSQFGPKSYKTLTIALDRNRENGMKRSRRVFLALAGSSAALTGLPRFASALDYPTRPVHIVVGFAAGLSPDIVGRLIGQTLSERLTQQFIVDNRPGAASNIGTEAVAHAPPDGYTLLLTISGNAINATLYTHLNFDFARDLIPVAGIGRTPFVIVVNPAFPIRSVLELIEYAKSNPGKINIASAGPGTGPHVACELFKMMTGVDMVQVPYKASYMTDLLGGQIPIAFSPIALRSSRTSEPANSPRSELPLRRDRMLRQKSRR